MTAAQAFSDPDLTFEEMAARIQELALAGDEDAIGRMEGVEMLRPRHERLVAGAGDGPPVWVGSDGRFRVGGEEGEVLTDEEEEAVLAALDALDEEQSALAERSASDIFYDKSLPVAEVREEMLRRAQAGDHEAEGYMESFANIDAHEEQGLAAARRSGELGQGGRAAASDLIAEAVARTGRDLRRMEGRTAEMGPHEVREVGPALKSAMQGALAELDTGEWSVDLNAVQAITNFSRPSTQVDLVVSSRDERWIAAELKVWDISHQLFDLAKVCCLLAAGFTSGVLICVAKASRDFERLPGGVLFPAKAGRSAEHDFADLIATHDDVWRRHVGLGGPEPTSIPRRVRTTAIVSGVEVLAYPGHEIRAVQVEVIDETPIGLENGTVPSP